nr:MAG TPA: hypothetical protein [Caudoviricetes sp.]
MKIILLPKSNGNCFTDCFTKNRLLVFCIFYR